MADWDANSPTLAANLKLILEQIHAAAARRERLSVETARRWRAETLRDLDVPDVRYVDAFRGEPGLEKVQVHVNSQFGVAAGDVVDALAEFQHTLQQIIDRLHQLIPAGVEPDADQTRAILEVCAWAHGEWIRIHPFANGSGRTARLWVNSIAMRHALPPFLKLRPRPARDYGEACAEAMRGNWEPTIAVFRQLLDDCLELPKDT